MPVLDPKTTSSEEITNTINALMPLAHGKSNCIASQFLEILSDVNTGHSVYFFEEEATVTPNSAAKILGVSRPTVLRLIEEGSLEAHLVGKRDKRISVVSVESFKENQAKTSRFLASKVINGKRAARKLDYAAAGLNEDDLKALGLM